MNLKVEWRWVSSPAVRAGAGTAQGGADAAPAVTVGTLGSTPSPGQRTVSSRPSAPVPVQQLVVRNGASALLRFAETVPVQWVQAWQAENRSAPGATQPRGTHPAGVQRGVSVQQGAYEAVSSLAVSPRWPGGSAVVDLELAAELPDTARPVAVGVADGALPAGHLSTRTVVLVPLGPWVTVAASGGSSVTDTAAPASAGWTVSTHDAARTPSGRELQVRLTVIP